MELRPGRLTFRIPVLPASTARRTTPSDAGDPQEGAGQSRSQDHIVKPLSCEASKDPEVQIRRFSSGDLDGTGWRRRRPCPASSGHGGSAGDAPHPVQTGASQRRGPTAMRFPQRTPHIAGRWVANSSRTTTTNGTASMLGKGGRQRSTPMPSRRGHKLMSRCLSLIKGNVTPLFRDLLATKDEVKANKQKRQREVLAPWIREQDHL